MVLDGVSFFYVTGQKLIIYFLFCHTDFLYFYNNMFLLAFYNKGKLL